MLQQRDLKGRNGMFVERKRRGGRKKAEEVLREAEGMNNKAEG